MVTSRLTVPTISYGAGVQCDGQGMVTADMLGLFDAFKPRFAKVYANLAPQIDAAIRQYCDEVRITVFLDDQHSYGMYADELASLNQQLSCT